MFGFRSSSGGSPVAPRWVGERVDSLRRSVAASWAAHRSHDSDILDLQNRIGVLERRDRAEAQRERRTAQAAPTPVQTPVLPTAPVNGVAGLNPEQAAALRNPYG
jgi:hypothetical protein